MRVEQQNANILDTLKQSIGPDGEQENVFVESILAKSKVSTENGVGHGGGKVNQSGNATSVNLKDATYLKPQTEEQKTAAEEIEQSGSMDATERKNQMAVLANTTSPEDYARMQEEGFSLHDTASGTIITETDKIKAQLAKAGVDISIFGDDLDVDQLEAILGSPELAMQLARTFERADIPCTEENMRDGAKALQLAGKLEQPGNGAIKYMIDNGLAPTIENLYMAEYSGSASYQPDQENGVDMSSFIGQVERIIQQAGLAVDDSTRADCQWMLQNQVPLNEENLKYMEVLKNLKLPVAADSLMERIATAVSEGGRPQDALLVGDASLGSRAESALAVAAEATDEDLSYLIDRGMDLTLRNLSYAIASRAAGVAQDGESAVDAQAQVDVQLTGTGKPVGGVQGAAGGEYTERGLALLTAKRQLEEIRLAMTAEANYALLKRGITIEMEPLAKLVEELKTTENTYYENLLRVQGVDASEENVSLFRETTETITDLKTVPAYVLGLQGIGRAAAGVVHEAGVALRDTFVRANERYETLMTAPRADLGDSIHKAFRNVDDILKDLGLDTSEANRRAVRILGYNEIEITPEAIAEMKAADEQVQRAFQSLKPRTVIEMIRQGINPLDMDFSSLAATAEQIGRELGTQENQKFSEFLWKLEKSDTISEEERASYIGTYRLIHQVEKTDGAAIGALVNQGAELTMRNLMMAVRSERHSGKMDYTVDESFGGSEKSGYGETSITDQIEASYQNHCLKDVVDTLTPEKLHVVMQRTADWESLTPEQLKEAIAQAETNDASLDDTYAKEQLAQLAQSAKASEDVYTILQKHDIPNTMSNIMAMEAMFGRRNEMFGRLFGKGGRPAVKETENEALQEAGDELLKEFGEAVAEPEKLAKAQEKLNGFAENVRKAMMESDQVSSIDVRGMHLISTQLSIGNLLAKEEQYSVPVLVQDGVVNVSLKIVRGAGQKGTVDVMMESEVHGKITATFQAKAQEIHGFVATDNAQTKELLEDQGASLAESLGGAEETKLRYAHVLDLDTHQFSMRMYEVQGHSAEAAERESEEYQVQTTRLYHIAESFIRQIREML